MENKLSPDSALIVVDYQNDFVSPRWALYVKWAETISQSISSLIAIFGLQGLKLIATKDWHPQNHISFASSHGLKPFESKNWNMLWPDHCIANLRWSQLFWLSDEIFHKIILKWYETDKDAYSGFKWTDLKEYLGQDWIKKLYLCGVATDYCVRESALDSIKLWYKTYLFTDAVKAVAQTSENAVLKDLQEIWVNLIDFDYLKKIV